ncbi:alpha-mannosidase [Vibrio alfacsensis]|uniref:Alpha-mannosidase n=1 Tax=Vibrio alfacsensis TaxID=1074311 RepID=A0ABM6YX08_9VIBR|nr:alpha-mannosidase [Vibrio alfacsensis]
MYVPDNITALLNQIGHRIYQPLTELKIEGWLTKEPCSFANRDSGDYRRFNIGDSWGGLFDCAWFRLSGTVPKHEHDLVLMVDVGGEGLVLDSQANPVRGITNKISSYGIPPDKPGKWVIDLNSQPGEQFEVWVDAGCNDLFGYVQNGGVITDAHLGSCNTALKGLYYDLEVLIDWINGDEGFVSHQPKGVQARQELKLESNEARFSLFIQLMARVEQTLVHYTADEIAQCRAILSEVYDVPSNLGSVDITATGHAHLDLAWMWPLREGKRKAMRTFTTAVANLDKYQDYLFGASQYQLFEWVKQDYPQLFSRIQDHVKEGRFELQGCFWVESDLNLVSGESLIRQIMYGRQFTQAHFGQSVNYLWEPDVFGFTAALPQILAKSGVDYIASQKLSQNKINPFPHHTFRWQGLDGSEVIMHNFPEDTYDSRARATSSLKIEANYKEKHICPEALMVYGVGDGGGGPAEEHIERFHRIQDLEGLPKAQNGRVDSFFTRVEKYREQLPVMNGELYFEAHQGCFTTESRTKQGNRDMEYLLGQLEALMAVTGDNTYKAELDRLWKETLTLQFHDILPGSSIVRVYQEAEADYGKLVAITEQLISKLKYKFERGLNTSMFAIPHIVYNLAPFARNEWLKVKNVWQKVSIPAFSYRVVEANATPFNAPFAEPLKLENTQVKVEFNTQGQITSLFNKVLNYEFVSQPRGNLLTAYKERATEYAAWDFADDYRTSEATTLELFDSSAYVDGPLAVVKQCYRYKNSTLTQEICIVEGSARVEFSTRINWQDQDISLKANFPVTVQAEDAQCNIQFGVIDRPTHSYDSFAAAKDEIPAHRWVDVTNGQQGIALMADAKYGYRVKDQELEITMLRSQKKPGSEFGHSDDADYTAKNFGDIGEHSFSYFIATHAGDYREGGVVEQGYALRELQVSPIAVQQGEIKPIDSVVSCDNTAVVIETLKLAEDGNGVVVRLFETYGKNQRASVDLSYFGNEVAEVNMIEESDVFIGAREGKLELEFTPFEVKTLRITT